VPTVIRTAKREDLPGILQVLEELPVTTGETDRFDIDETRAQEMWSKILAQDGRTVLVAEENGEIVGTLDLIVVPNLTHDLSPWAMLENVVVAQADRRQGVGRALVEEAITRARAAGCYKVQLLSFKERVQAHEFYRSLGFEALAEGFRMYF
jgi:ribosomal protein S18 acetylase RimI-like enzyme